MGPTMDKIGFDYNSPRSEKARIAVRLNKKWQVLLIIVAMLLFASGIYMLFLGVAVGWALLGVSVMPVMVTGWYKGELNQLKVKNGAKTIDDILAVDVLGHMSKRPTPQELAAIVSNLNGGQFFAFRFGISASFLQTLTSSNEDDMQAVWREAWKLYEQTNSDNISSIVLMAALIKCAPNYEVMLGHLQLEIEDLVHGVEWYNHIINIIDNRKAPRRTGGIARDWSFGWTPLLNRFGTNISQDVGSDSFLIKLAAHDDSLNQLQDIFGKNGRQNAVLVGPTGCGKTQIVRAFASRLMDASAKIPSSLLFRQIFILDASALIASAAGRGELEQLVPQVLAEAYNAKNIIICLDNAQLFFEDGIGSVDITNVLLPILEAGNLRMILAMDEQQYLKISNRNPQIMNSLNRINVTPASKSETIAVMQDQSIMIEYQNHVTYMYQALAETYRLSDRYVHDLAMPGRALKLLESAAHYSENGLVTAKSVQQTIEKTLDIKVGVATGDDEREKLLNLEALIHERMINQSRAVSVVCDALRRARAGVRNQNRPIGTFLFLGPTGVGKTELAKSLACVYFGGEDRIVRLDMNEYSNADDAARLIADGADNPNSLTARTMKQPFSVVLLDEIEKAHPNVLATLLQLLDEGVLRDVKNREVSFRDTIVIATSNAGADKIREYIERGYDIEKFEDKLVDELIDGKQFLPEFLNRFDEIVMFRPLKKDELIKVVDLMIEAVNKTLSLQKISVNVSTEAKTYLVEAGYDPRLGARPMRRAIQTFVENKVASMLLQINAFTSPRKLHIKMNLAGDNTMGEWLC